MVAVRTIILAKRPPLFSISGHTFLDQLEMRSNSGHTFLDQLEMRSCLSQVGLPIAPALMRR